MFGETVILLSGPSGYTTSEGKHESRLDRLYPFVQCDARKREVPFRLEGKRH